MVRVKRRYLVFELIPTSNAIKRHEEIDVNERDIVNAIKQQINEIHGDFGVGAVAKSIHINRFSRLTRVGVLTCVRGPNQLIGTSLPFVRSVKNISCCFKSLYLSGTIRGCLKYIRELHSQQVRQLKEELAHNRKLNLADVDMAYIQLEQAIGGEQIECDESV